MELILPKRLNTNTLVTLDTRVVVVIGANGAGKSSFGKDLVKRYGEQAEYISGMHSLFLNTENDALPETSETNLLQEFIAKRVFMPRLSAYERLLLQLQHEEYDAAVNYKEACKTHPALEPPVTKTDRIQTVWEKMFPQNRLVRKSGFIEITSASRKGGGAYTPERMSDGEKIVFYLIGAVLCSRPNALLIIEEPEVLLHDSIKNVLWDEIEAMRPDCTFVYLTHDIHFATSRAEGRCLWIRSYDGDNPAWDYVLIEDSGNFPEELYIELLGSRKPILFIEGTSTNSIDNRLYPLVFPDYLVKPVGGCQKVIETTKAFRQLNDFHLLDSMGIVDRDRRTQGEIDYLHEQHIFVPDVAEVENLLMLEPIIKVVARRLMKNPEAVFGEVKEHVIKLFEKDLEAQVILHARYRVRKKLETAVNRKIATIEELAEHIDGLRETIHVHDIYNGIKDKFIHYAGTKNYEKILLVYNQKGMLPQSHLCKICGISNKESYLNLVLSILKEGGTDTVIIRAAIKESLGM
jgi:ABC-type branched-subunit amino acid transport system ATPase component